MSNQRTNGYCMPFVVLLALLVPVGVFGYEARPFSSTAQATFVTEKSIQLNGRVNPSELPDTYVWFEWGIVGRSAVYETSHQRIFGTDRYIDTSASLVGLAPATQYFYRQVAENSHGKDVGQTVYATTKQIPSTLEPLALVTTNTPNFVEESSAVLRGYVSPHGNSGTRMWFEWGPTPSVAHETPHQNSGNDSVFFETKLQYLLPGTVYYFRAVVENGEGRMYGVLRSFSTNGSAAVVSEPPREQFIPAPIPQAQASVSRTVTTSGASANIAKTSATPPPVAQVSGGALPQATNRPGDFLGLFFGGKKEVTPAPAPDVRVVVPITPDAPSQAAATAESSGNLLKMFSGTKDIEVVIEKVGLASPAMHTPVEYRVAYAYRKAAPATDAKLKITLPKEVIYIGDNTNNELLLATGSNVERTYILPLGRIENGSTRVMSILGMTTGSADGFPSAAARLEYADAGGAHIIAAVDGDIAHVARANVAGTGSLSGKFLPGSFMGWIIYIFSVVVCIIGIRKAKEYYTKRKEALVRAEATHANFPETPRYFPGAEEVASQRI